MYWINQPNLTRPINYLYNDWFNFIHGGKQQKVHFSFDTLSRGLSAPLTWFPLMNHSCYFYFNFKLDYWKYSTELIQFEASHRSEFYLVFMKFLDGRLCLVLNNYDWSVNFINVINLVTYILKGKILPWFLHVHYKPRINL